MKGKLFEDSNGNESTGRIAFIGVIAFAMFMTATMLFMGKDFIDMISVWSSITGLAIVIKGMGKSQENTELKILKSSGEEVWGCMDKGADNYNKYATRDDGTYCKYTVKPDPNG